MASIHWVEDPNEEKTPEKAESYESYVKAEAEPEIHAESAKKRVRLKVLMALSAAVLVAAGIAIVLFVKNSDEQVKVSALIQYKRGGDFYNKGDYENAITAYTQAITLVPDYYEAYYDRARAYAHKGDTELELKDYDKVINFCSNKTLVSSACFNYGCVFQDLDEYDQAIQYYTKAIELDPNAADAYNNRGNAYQSKDLYDVAIQDFTKAIELDPNYNLAYYNRGETYRLKGMYDAAIQDCDTAISLNPNYAPVYATRGAAYNAKGQKDLAIQDLEKTISLDPDYQWAKDKLKEIRGW